ncbi:MAG: hypothetical protein KC609_01650 [Myxococcales bacterium]|nr:hypothetical protein [Myxococcales bacterium]
MVYLLWAVTIGAVLLLFLLWDKKAKEIEQLRKELDGATAGLAAEQKRQSQSRSEFESSKKELKELRDKEQAQRQKLHSTREELKKVKQDLVERERELKGQPKPLITEPDFDERPRPQAAAVAPTPEATVPSSDSSSEIEALRATIAELEQKAALRFREYEAKHAEKVEASGARDLEKAQAKLAKLEKKIDDYKQKALAAEKEKRAALRKAESNQTVFLVTKSQLEATEERLRMLENKVRDALKAPATERDQGAEARTPRPKTQKPAESVAATGDVPKDAAGVSNPPLAEPPAEAPSPTADAPSPSAEATTAGVDSAKTGKRKPKKPRATSETAAPAEAETPSVPAAVADDATGQASSGEADANAS